MATICPLCEQGSLTTLLVDETINYRGEKLIVENVAISSCALCGDELVLPEQARSNERLFADAKRRQDHLYTSDEIVAWRKALNLTQVQAAQLLGGGTNAFSKYERGEVMQARSMDLLMRVVRSVPGAREFLEEFANGVVEKRVVRRLSATAAACEQWVPEGSGNVVAVSFAPSRAAANDHAAQYTPMVAYG